MSDPRSLIAAYQADPENTQAFRDLEELLFGEAMWNELAELYRVRLTSHALRQNQDAALDLLNRRAQILEERCLNDDAAIEAYWAVAQLAPSHAGALRQLRRIHTRRGEFDMALEIADIENSIEMSDHERASALTELGELWERKLDDLANAQAQFERAIEIDPGQQDALAGLARCHQSNERFSEAAAAWTRVIEVQRGPDRALALIALGHLAAGPLKDAALASECFRRALTDDPRNGEAVEALVAQAVAQENWELLADLFERRFDIAAGAKLRTGIALEASRLHLERMDNPQTARLWLGRARDLAADDPEVQLVAAAIERRAGNREALLEALEAAIRNDENPSLDTLLEAAEMCAERDEDERALYHLRRAEALAPKHPQLVTALDQCLHRLCRDGERAEVLERRAELESDAATECVLQVELAQLRDGVLEDPSGAERAWRRAFELDAAHPEAGKEVARLLHARDEPEELRRVLERLCENGPQEQRCEHLCGLGDLLDQHFEDAAAATQVYERALELDANSSRALEGLAQVAQESGDEDAMIRAYSREAQTTADPRRLAELVWELSRIFESREQPEQALEWLQRLHQRSPRDRACLGAMVRFHEALGNHNEVLSTLEALESVSNTGEKAEVQKRLAEVCGALDLSEDAIRWAEASLANDAQQREVAETLVELYRRGQRHADRARAQRKLASLLPEAEKRACLKDLASLLEEPLGDLDAAVVILWDIATSDDASAQEIEHLASVLDRAERFEELAQLLLEQRRKAETKEAAREIDLRRGALLVDSLGRFEEGAELYRTLLEADPNCEASDNGLETALRRGNDTLGLAQLLSERAERSEDPTERCQLQLEAARLLEEAGSDGSALREALTRLAEQEDDTQVASEAGARLESLLERNGDWAALRARCEQHLAKVQADSQEQDARSELALRERLAALCRDRLSDNAACIEHLEAASRLAPERSEIWQSLALLHSDRDPVDLRRVLQGELASGPDSEREIALRGRIASLCLQLGDDAGAKSQYEALLALEPAHAGASEYLIEHYAESGDSARLLEVLQQRLDALCTANEEAQQSQRSSLRLRIGALQAEELEDLDAAIQTLQDALPESGDLIVVEESLADLLARAGRYPELASVCRVALDKAQGAPERGRWNLRLADSLLTTGDREGAVEAYRNAAEDLSDPRGAEAALLSLYRELELARPLSELLHAQLTGRCTPQADPLELHLELAILYSGPLSQSGRALSEVREVLAIDPKHPDALALALEMSGEIEDPQELDGLLAASLDAARSPEQRCELLSRRADLAAGRLGEPSQAIAFLREILALTPNAVPVRQRLRELYQETGKWRAALDCLYTQARALSGEARRELFEEGVELARENLSLDATLPWLERLRAEDPSDCATLARIADLHRQAGRPEALLRAIDAQLEQLENGDEACEAEQLQRLHCDRSRILERDLQAPGRALAALEAANKAAPGDTAILRDLARLRGVKGMIREQLEALEEIVAALPGDAAIEDRVSLLEEIANLAVGELADPERAGRHLQAALAMLSPNSLRRPELLRSLRGVYRELGDASQWARCAEAELAAFTAKSERTDLLLLSLAECYETELFAPERARAQWSLLAQRSLDTSFDEVRLDAIDQGLLRAHRRMQDPIALAERLEAWLERHTGDGEAWLELAQLCDERLAMPERAAAAYRGTLRCTPSSLIALRGLRNSSERLRDWNSVIESLQAELEVNTELNAADRAALLRQAASLSLEKTGDSRAAAEQYSQALGLIDDDLDSLRALQGLCESHADYSSAVAHYERECEVLSTREEDETRQQESYLRAGTLSRDELADTERALRAYEGAAQLGRLPEAQHRAFAELLEQAGQDERARDEHRAWCDRADSSAKALDHLSLAERLDEIDQSQEALERTRSATQCEAEDREAWDALARRAHSAGRALEAAEALETAAALSSDAEACERLVGGALALESCDGGESQVERALEWLRRASAADPGAAFAHAHRARIAEELENWDEAQDAATRALEADTNQANHSGTSSPTEHMDDALRFDAAMAGGRASREREDPEAAAIFFSAALRSQPDQPDALAAAGELAFTNGDLASARDYLSRRLDAELANPKASAHHTVVGAALEASGDRTQALEHFEKALELEATRDAAHDGCVRIHLATEQPQEASAALYRWADASENSRTRSAALLEAAKLEAAEGKVEDAASALRRACEENDADPQAWVELAELLEARQDPEALDIAEKGLRNGGDADADATARLAWVCAKQLEEQDRPTEAADAYACVWESNSRHSAAALAEARLRRHEGEWQEAADLLGRFAEQHPDNVERGGEGAIDLAEVFDERARLLAGPLEQVAEAIHCYERALQLDPERHAARAKIASLFALIPERRAEAVDAHAKLLRHEPTCTESLRALLKLTQDSSNDANYLAGLGILRALGIATPSESAQASTGLRFALARSPRMNEELSERLRCAIVEAADGFGALAPDEAGRDATGFGVAIRDAHDELSAPGLYALSAEPFRDALLGLVALAVDPTSQYAETPTALRLDGELGRRALRRLRKQLDGTELDRVAKIDTEEWRAELHALATAVALDRQGGDLRAALEVLIDEFCEGVLPGAETDLTPLVRMAPAAGRLLSRVTSEWCDRIARDL